GERDCRVIVIAVEMGRIFPNRNSIHDFGVTLRQVAEMLIKQRFSALDDDRKGFVVLTESELSHQLPRSFFPATHIDFFSSSPTTSKSASTTPPLQTAPPDGFTRT